MDHGDVRYLESKRTVDDRARSRRVRDCLLAELPETPSLVDVGAGTGSMLRALLSWDVRRGTYRGVDRSAALVEHCRRSLPEALRDEHLAIRPEAGDRDGFVVEGISAIFEVGDLRKQPEDRVDLVTAQAMLDLLPIVEAMDAIERLLRPGGLAYLPITFDGVSVFRPAHPDDVAVVDAYHAAIDDRPGRDSQSGRRLIEHLPARRGELLAVDASDWIVRPRGNGYPADEAHFLGCILDFVADGVDGAAVDADPWLSARRRQLAAAELSFVAHGYDFLYRAPEP